MMSQADRADVMSYTLPAGAWQAVGNSIASTDSTEYSPAVTASARRAALDMRLAGEVHARLFPRKLPHLETLSYAGVSLPAGLVGGDYFDFLDLGRGYLGMAVGDVAGKGVAAALLMANLQAHVRSQCALAVEDLSSVLRSVNRLFCESTAPSSFATLFFAEYCDAGRKLRFVNCGHPAPLLCRKDGAVQRLGATATVLGIEEDWDCEIEEMRLLPGDSLVLYTDGLTEAMNERGEEFGEHRVAALLSASATLPPSSRLQLIFREARQFAGREFQDDFTLVAASCATV